MATIEQFCENPPVATPTTEEEVCLNWGVLKEMHSQVCAFLEGGGTTKAWAQETLSSGNEISIDITYQGDLPVLTRVDDGQFLITNQANSLIKGYTINSGSAPSFMTGGAFSISIADTDGDALHGVYSVHQNSNGRKMAESGGVIETQQELVPGTVTTQFTNVENLTGGFFINCAITR
ncbi:MAG: hypothetical protein ACWA44_02490 [Thiotrichales bacterium]